MIRPSNETSLIVSIILKKKTNSTLTEFVRFLKEKQLISRVLFMPNFTRYTR